MENETIIKKKKLLDWLFYDIGKQQQDFELCGLYRDSEGNSKSLGKWRKYSEICSDIIKNSEEFKKINCRQILQNEIVLDLDEPEAINNLEVLLKKLKEDNFKFYCYKTGSKGYHIHIFFEKPVDEKIKENFISDFGGDLSKKSKRNLIALEDWPHWKTGNLKELISFDEGINSNISLNAFLDNDSEEDEEVDEVETIVFDFDLIEPEKEITKLQELEEVIKKNFPSIWFETKACLSACATLSLKNLNGCPSINLIGNPSGEKTTVLSFFYGQRETYMSDDFTPRAFVSHSANVKKEDLGAVDLLPKIKNKILITPELAPLFESPKDKLIDNFAMLTRVLDGEGLNRDSGTHGHRGYSGDYKFVWLGASTPLRSSVWNVMGKIGNRLFFLDMRDKNRSNSDYLDMFRGRAYEEKVKECRGAVRSFLNNLFEKNKIRNLEWDAEGDILLLPEIIKYAKFLARLRATLMTWRGEDGDYEYNFPLTEEPPRAINALYNLAKGHALINARNFLRKEDMEIVRAVCFSSMPHDRHEFLKLLAKHEGRLTSMQIEKELNCSIETALRTMKFFEILGIVTVKSLNVGEIMVGRPMKYIEINKEFEELIIYTQGTNNETNNKSHEKISVSDYDNLNLDNFIEKKDIHTGEK